MISTRSGLSARGSFPLSSLGFMALESRRAQRGHKVFLQACLGGLYDDDSRVGKGCFHCEFGFGQKPRPDTMKLRTISCH